MHKGLNAYAYTHKTHTKKLKGTGFNFLKVPLEKLFWVLLQHQNECAAAAFSLSCVRRRHTGIEKHNLFRNSENDE